MAVVTIINNEVYNMKSCRQLFGIMLPGLLTASIAVQAGEVPAGAGSFTAENPSHRWAPATGEGYDQTVPEGDPWGIYTPRQEQSPSVSDYFKSTGKPTPTHEFWSSVLWPHAVKNQIGRAHVVTPVTQSEP